MHVSCRPVSSLVLFSHNATRRHYATARRDYATARTTRLCDGRHDATMRRPARRDNVIINWVELSQGSSCLVGRVFCWSSCHKGRVVSWVELSQGRVDFYLCTCTYTLRSVLARRTPYMVYQRNSFINETHLYFVYLIR